MRVQARRRHGGSLAVQVVVPCDTAALAHSPDLPPSIYEPGEELFGAADGEELLSALGFEAQSAWSPQPPKIVYGLSHNLLRYNRVEGLSAGIGVVQTLGRGFGVDATAQLGVADLTPNGEVGIARSSGRDSLRLAAYHRLAVANDWGTPLGFGASLNALLFARDEGFYYRSWGAEVVGVRDRGPALLSWRLFAERHGDADVETQFSLAHALNDARFIENIDVVRGFSGGAGLRYAFSRGLDPRGWRLLGDLRAEGAAGRFDYGRAALDLTISHALGPKLDGALTLGGGTTGGTVPAQRLFYLGGSHTVRGQRAGEPRGGVGDAYWLARVELGLGTVAARPVLFGDLGWAGSREDFSSPGRPMSGVGVGASFLDGLVRFDVARGIQPRAAFRADLYVEARF